MGEVVIKDPRPSVTEGYPHIGHSARHPRISLLHNNTGAPLGKPRMEYLITRLEVQAPRFLFHSNPLRPSKAGPHGPELCTGNPNKTGVPVARLQGFSTSYTFQNLLKRDFPGIP